MTFLRQKPSFFILFTLISLIPAVCLTRLFQYILIQINSGSIELIKSFIKLGFIEAPTTLAIIAFFFWIYERFLWYRKPFYYLQRFSNLTGRYKGEYETSFDGKKYPCFIEIRQSLLQISISLYALDSSSFSTMTSVGKNQHGTEFVAYAYKNTPRTISRDLDMRPHDGFACLDFFSEENKLEGFYYNDPRDRGRHGKISCTFLQKKLIGHFVN